MPHARRPWRFRHRRRLGVTPPTGRGLSRPRHAGPLARGLVLPKTGERSWDEPLQSSGPASQLMRPLVSSGWPRLVEDPQGRVIRTVRRANDTFPARSRAITLMRTFVRLCRRSSRVAERAADLRSRSLIRTRFPGWAERTTLRTWKKRAALVEAITVPVAVSVAGSSTVSVTYSLRRRWRLRALSFWRGGRLSDDDPTGTVGATRRTEPRSIAT